LEEAEAAAAARQRAEETARRQSALLVVPLNSAPPPPKFTGQTGEDGGEHPIVERDRGEASASGTASPPPPPPPHGKQPAGPPMPPTEEEAVARLLLQVASPARRRLEKAVSAPRPLEAGAASSAIPDAEATSAVPTWWVQGGGDGLLNQALLDVQAKLRAEGEAIQGCTRAHLASRASIRVRFSFLTLSLLVLLCGGASCCAGGPELNLASSSFLSLSDCLSQEYHNLRVTAFNRNVEQLGKRTADLSESQSKFFFFFAGACWRTCGL